MADVSVVVVTYNALPWLERCLESVRAYETIVVDHGSTDGTLELVRRMPDESAYRVLSTGQKRFFVGLLAVFLICLVINPITTIVVFNIASVVFYIAFSIYRFALIYNAIAHDLELPVSADEVAALDERTLPVYTLLVPLYQEAAVLPRLLDGIAGLDYPATKLDVKILVESDDARGFARALTRVAVAFGTVLAVELHPDLDLIVERLDFGQLVFFLFFGFAGGIHAVVAVGAGEDAE